MESLGFLEIALVVSVSVGGAIVVAFGFWIVSNWGLSHQYASADGIVPTFLFDGENLKDATPDAQLLIKDVPKFMTDKQSVLHILSSRFPTLETVFDKLNRGETQTLHAADSTTISLEVAEIEGLIQLKLFGTCVKDTLTISEIAAQDAWLSELATLRKLTELSPHLVWQQDADGKLIWANTAYLNVSDSLSDDQDKAARAWPHETIFPDLHLDAEMDKTKKRRVSIDIPDQHGEAWFDVTTLKNGSNAVHFGHCVNDTVSAEYAKRQSVQTFGRIFANLSTGLAIFDEKRRLTMFNPALIEMTNLAPEFLSSKPTIQMFLDRLRESRLLPEPKDYIKWREQFTNIVEAGYCESWDIADGQTFKVTGQPDRDGSYAFFFEDISAELSLTRRFRSDIETGQGVLDALPEAIAVFSANGTLVMSNRAYGRLWDVDHDTSVRSYDLRAEMLIWQSQCAAAPIWHDLREFIGQGGTGRNYWTDRAVLDDGRQFTCKAQTISGGMTMISFTTSARIKPRVQTNLTRPDEAIYGLKG
jgi:PAS domain-containing protein